MSHSKETLGRCHAWALHCSVDERHEVLALANLYLALNLACSWATDAHLPPAAFNAVFHARDDVADEILPKLPHGPAA
jgi:hypothetical protein